MNYLLNRDLEGVTEFTSESCTDSNGCVTDETNGCVTVETKPNESSDTGLLVAVIVLAVIILLLFVGAGVAYLRYVRSVF
jgi:hypothetical protein